MALRGRLSTFVVTAAIAVGIAAGGATSAHAQTPAQPQAAPANFPAVAPLQANAAPHAVRPSGIAGDWTVVNADGGVYWRNSPNWNDTSRITGSGIYNGDQLYLACWSWGGPVDPYGNTLWYYAYDDTRGQQGWVNDHFLNTPGTAANPQIQSPYHC